ncbi:MAG: GGDEF domain-containing protein [Gammaproteobacteria bacterium]|nr:GGDEF domain-containing protein [Gammaproteobacteria bacterium]
MTEKSEITGFLVDTQLLKRLEMCTTLPSPPVVAMRILDLSQDPDVDIGKVADVVSMDPALTAKILRIANSPIYAIRRKTENLRQAIMLLGLNGTLTMALSFSLAASMQNNACQGFDYNLFWRRSLAAAVCGRRLCVAAGIGASEEIFLAGLLQDIGMLALDKFEPEFYKDLGVDQSDHNMLQELEREKLGADHAAIGGWLLQKWNLPVSLQFAVAGSHNLQYVDSRSEHFSYALCVALSGLFSDALSLDDGGQSLMPVLNLVKENLAIDEETLLALPVTLNEDFMEVASMFETDLTDYSFSEALIDQAREALVLRNLQTIQKSDKLQVEAAMLESRTKLLEEQARRDGLTGVFNRAYLDDKIDSEFKMAKARDWPLAVMFVDLDHFKSVNDNYGHQVGDDVLRVAANLLCTGTRDTDIVARYGGEEFVIVLPGSGEQAANVVIERLLKIFREKRHPVQDGGEITVTASIGMAVMGEGTTFTSVTEMLGAADEAVYAAKARGRDCCVIYSNGLDGKMHPDSNVVSRA